MRVTQIQEVTKSRSKVIVDEEFAFVLYKGELRRYHILQGEEISEDAWEEIMHTILPKRAKLRCMNLLGSKDYTRKQLEDKLAQGGYPKEIINQAIEYVTSFGYIDDLRYAQSYIEYYMSTRSKTRLKQDLMKKGISKEDLEQAFSVWQEQGGRENEQSMIRRILEKKQYDPLNCEYKEKQKLIAHLLRKGFSMDMIRKEISVQEEEW